MKVINQLTYVDKEGWGDGPWQTEPDKIQMLDEETGLDCLIVRGPVGALCGYVGVDESHPLFGKGYSDLDLDCHGGLTFSNLCQEKGKEHGICHVPLPGRPDKVWWLGFDCAHAFDLCPQMNKLYKQMPNIKYNKYHKMDTYRDVEYVKSECGSLAKQIKNYANDKIEGRQPEEGPPIV